LGEGDNEKEESLQSQTIYKDVLKRSEIVQKGVRRVFGTETPKEGRWWEKFLV